MTLPTYARTWILEAEGGYVDNPKDPGGETKYGISKRAYPMLDIEKLTPDDAARIYFRDYWRAVDADQFRPAHALAIFDAAVNQGPKVAVRLFQLALGIRVDGIVGPTTLKAERDAFVSGTVVRFMEVRWDRYYETSGAGSFLRGWTRRLFQLERACLDLASVA